MSLSTLITKVKYNIGSRSDKDAVITEYLNQAVSDAAEWADWEDLKSDGSTVALAYGNYYVAKPSVYRKVSLIRLKTAGGDYYNVPIVGKSIFRALVPDMVPVDYSIPTCCHLQNNIFYFDYLADQAFTVYYDGYKYPTAMSSPSDEPSIDGIDDFLVAQATGYVFASIERFDISVFWFNLAAQKIQKKVDETSGPLVDHLEPY